MKALTKYSFSTFSLRNSLLHKLRSILLLGFLAVSLASITACSTSRFPGAYRIDVPQGNVLSEKDVAKLREGLSKDQVKYILGSPIAENTFRPSSWTYIYTLKKGNGEEVNKRVTLDFNQDGKVATITKN